MNELIAGVIGALVGAVAAYGLGWSQKALDDRRRRRAVATGLQIEVYWISHSLAYLRDEWQRTQAVVHFPTAVHEDFVHHLEHFKPATVYKVLDFVGTLRDIQKGLGVISEGSATNPDAIRNEIKFLSKIGIIKALSASKALQREGGRIPDDTEMPSEDDISAFLSEVVSPWKIRGSPSSKDAT